MKRYTGEQGFFLLETIILAAVLVLMAGALLLFRRGVIMEEHTRFEAAATCLGESELARLEYRASAGQLAEGRAERWERVAFSPEEREDRVPGGDFLLRTTIQRMEQGDAFLVGVTVSWQAHGGRLHERSYQRRMGAYEETP